MQAAGRYERVQTNFQNLGKSATNIAGKALSYRCWEIQAILRHLGDYKATLSSRQPITIMLHMWSTYTTVDLRTSKEAKQHVREVLGGYKKEGEMDDSPVPPQGKLLEDEYVQKRIIVGAPDQTLPTSGVKFLLVPQVLQRCS